MIDIGRPFTDKELKYIEDNRDIIENGRLKDLLSTESPDYMEKLIYFLAACIRGELKFTYIDTINAESKFRLDSGDIRLDSGDTNDPLGLGTDTPIRLLLRLANRFKIDPEKLRQILIEFGIAEDGSKTR